MPTMPKSQSTSSPGLFMVSPYLRLGLVASCPLIEPFWLLQAEAAAAAPAPCDDCCNSEGPAEPRNFLPTAPELEAPAAVGVPAALCDVWEPSLLAVLALKVLLWDSVNALGLAREDGDPVSMLTTRFARMLL